MAPKFGTSGLRGLVTDLTPELIARHVDAFLAACPVGSGLFVAHDLRDSSPRIAADVIETAVRAGLPVTDCGALPTPALALAAMQAGAAAIMVTGSHIPADRNGLKFYTPAGEITKAQEGTILAALGSGPAPRGPGSPPRKADFRADFLNRSLHAFGPAALEGLRIGVWSHSAVGRDLLIDTLAALGATVVDIGRSDHFIPVDTEALPDQDRAFLRAAARSQGLWAIASTDGDGDRPLLTDEQGNVIPGDVLGRVTAQMLGAEVVVTPVSSNTGVEASGRFARVIRTRIGSPFVIAGIEAALSDHPDCAVVGYEANGGFLLGFDARLPQGNLPALMTRDSHLPIVATLVAARDCGGLAALIAREPARFTAADRLQGIEPARAVSFLNHLGSDEPARTAFLAQFDAGRFDSVDTTDGLRFTFSTGRILHLRPSGNAPEFRIYTEAEDPTEAARMLVTGLAELTRVLG